MPKRVRKKIHAPYIDIPHYQHFARKSDAEVAAILGYSVRSYKEKIAGYSDFSAVDMGILADLFNVSVDLLYRTA